MSQNLGQKTDCPKEITIEITDTVHRWMHEESADYINWFVDKCFLCTSSLTFACF